MAITRWTRHDKQARTAHSKLQDRSDEQALSEVEKSAQLLEKRGADQA